MIPERFERLRAILEEALEKRAEDRTRFLEEACGADSELREEIESLRILRLSQKMHGGWALGGAATVQLRLEILRPYRIAQGAQCRIRSHAIGPGRPAFAHELGQPLDGGGNLGLR